MGGNALISTDVVARYAAGAALEVPGVHAHLAHLARQRAVRADAEEDGHPSSSMSRSIGVSRFRTFAANVQLRVREDVERMTDVELDAVDVAIDEVA